jgi:hypothetical protein
MVRACLFKRSNCWGIQEALARCCALCGVTALGAASRGTLIGRVESGNMCDRPSYPVSCAFVQHQFSVQLKEVQCSHEKDVRNLYNALAS